MPGIDVTDTTITFSQSWTNTFFNCPQQAFLEMKGLLPRKETDATAAGNALHTGAEFVLGGHGTLTEGEDAAYAELERLMSLPEFEFVQVKTKDTLVAAVQRVYWTWANEVFPQLPTPVGIEEPFDVSVANTPYGELRIKGSIDMRDELGDINDWKTANGFHAWKQHEVEKKLQPTFYFLGMMLTDPEWDYQAASFNFVVMNKQKQEHLVLSTKRGDGHFTWLVQQLTSIAKLIRADLDSWPLFDNSFLCSPKWATCWDSCKGKHL